MVVFPLVVILSALILRRRPVAQGLSSPTSVGVVLHAGITGVAIDPVDLPSLAAVGRKGLLRLSAIWGDRPNGEAHQDGFAVDGLLIVEVAAAVGEFADVRYPQGADFGR